MIADGMDPKRLSAAGYADELPVGDNATDEGRRANRRIEIVVQPNLNELPGHGRSRQADLVRPRVRSTP